MRKLSLVLAGLVAFAAAAPALAREDPNLPGVNITITKRSYLDPGPVVPQRSWAWYAQSNLYGNTFDAPAYEGVVGFRRYPLPEPLYIPGAEPITVDFQAPPGLVDPHGD